MRSERVNYVLVGGFVLTMLAGVIFVVAALTGRTGATDTYFTRYDDATGIKYGTQVLYMGYKVGQVEKVIPVVEEGQVKFDLELAVTRDLAGWKVPRDSVAQIRSLGLLSGVAVDIRAGSGEEQLEPGDYLQGVGRSNMFAALSDTASTMHELTVTGIKPLVENLNHYVTSLGDVLELRTGPLMDNLGALSAELAARAPAVIDDFLQTSNDLRVVSRRVEATLSDENAGKLTGIVDNVLAASDDLARLTGNARGQLEVILTDDMVMRTQRVIGNVDLAAERFAAAGEGMGRMLSPDNLSRIDNALRDAEQASAAARELVSTGQKERVDAMLTSAGNAAEELEVLIRETREQVRVLVKPETVRRFDVAMVNISDAAANMARLSENLDERVETVFTPQLTSKLKRTLENFSLAAANVATLTRGLEESRGDLDALLVALRGMAEDNRADVRASVLDLRHSLDVVAQNIDAVAQNLEGTSRNMAEFSRRLKANPGLLLRGGRPAADEAELRRGG